MSQNKQYEPNASARQEAAWERCNLKEAYHGINGWVSFEGYLKKSASPLTKDEFLEHSEKMEEVKKAHIKKRKERAQERKESASVPANANTSEGFTALVKKKNFSSLSLHASGSVFLPTAGGASSGEPATCVVQNQEDSKNETTHSNPLSFTNREVDKRKSKVSQEDGSCCVIA